MNSTNLSRMIKFALTLSLLMGIQGISAEYMPVPSMLSMGQMIKPPIDLEDDDIDELNYLYIIIVVLTLFSLR
mgnify:CR=1 FL=1